MEEHESRESDSLVSHHSESDSPLATTGFAIVTTAETALVPTNVPPSIPTNFTVDLSNKKKRGRPRKYDSDGNLRVPIIKSPPPPPGFTLSTSNKTIGNWQMFASLGEAFGETAGTDFTPHVLNVLPGEDVAAKILSISQKAPFGICVLAANGVVSNVTLRQPGSSGGILTYEGRFELLSLSGTFTISENSGVRSRSGGLSVTLAGADGRVIGGGVAGLLLAATPIQIVAGSFVPNVKTNNKQNVSAANVVMSATPLSQAVPIINDKIKQNPICQMSGVADNEINVKPTTLSSSSPERKVTDPAFHQSVYPDINASIPE